MVGTRSLTLLTAAPRIEWAMATSTCEKGQRPHSSATSGCGGLVEGFWSDVTELASCSCNESLRHQAGSPKSGGRKSPMWTQSGLMCARD
jgi:hypothetical protein